jgi:hypothetical protein
LIAGLESDINLVGIDRAQNLIEIGSTLSSSLGNVTLVTADHTNYAAEVRYGTIVSICGLTFDYPAEFDEEFPDPTSGSPAWRLDHIQSVARRSLQQWRRKVKDGGALLSLERLPTRDDIAAFIAEAAQIGFIIDFERSTYLHCGEERFPAMRFVAGQPSEIDLGPLASWSWKA